MGALWWMEGGICVYAVTECIAGSMAAFPPGSAAVGEVPAV